MNGYLVSFLVASALLFSTGDAVMSVGNAPIELGEPITINFSGIDWTSGDWIAMYDQKDLTSYRAYRYVDTNLTTSVTFDEGVFGLLTLKFVYFNPSEVEQDSLENVQVVNTMSIDTDASQYGLGEKITVSFTASAWHSTGDYIGMYPETGCTFDPEFPDNCLRDYQYVPEGPTGSLEFSAPDNEVANFIFRYISSESEFLAATTAVSVIASQTLDAPSVALSVTLMVVSFTSTPEHGLGDYIAMFPVGGCPTTHDCYLSYVYVPAGASGTVFLYVPYFAQQTTVELRYLISTPNGELLVSNQPQVDILPLGTGVCISGCDNTGDFCTLDDDCTNCGTTVGTCVIPDAPIFVPPTPADGFEYIADPGQTITFQVAVQAAPGSGPVEIFGNGLSGAQYDSVVTGDKTTTTVTYTPTEEDQSSYLYVYFLGIDSLGYTTDTVVVIIRVRGSVCSSWGDPHLQSLDAYSFDFQGAGDFTMIESFGPVPKLSVQARFRPCYPGSTVTCNSGIAVNHLGVVFSAYYNPVDETTSVYFAGEPVNFNPDNDTAIVLSGATIQAERYYGSRSLKLVYNSGVKITLEPIDYLFGGGMVISVPGQYSGFVRGLCGNYDGDNTNDLTYANGTAIDTETSSNRDIYDWGVSWRVAQLDSHFDYTLPGASYTQVNDANFVPTLTIEWPSPELQQQAEDLCGSFGLDEQTYQGCLFDIALIGSLDAASAAALNSVRVCDQRTGTNCLVNNGCPGYCSFRGKCNADDTCTCTPGWMGDDCSTPVPSSELTAEATDDTVSDDAPMLVAFSGISLVLMVVVALF